MRNNDDYGIVFVTKVTSKNVQTNIIKTVRFPLFSEKGAINHIHCIFTVFRGFYIFMTDL